MIEINGAFTAARDTAAPHQPTEPVMRPLTRLAPLPLVLLLSAGPALAGDPEAGQQLAAKWCANCHMITPTQETATAIGVPTFSGIARMASTTETSLRVFFQTPHVRMPDLHLSMPEIDDVSAYILSLKGR